MKLSANLIARDEAHRLERCLDALRWADEVVIVVDDRSGDGTAEVARRRGAQVHVRTFDDYAAMRQFAVDRSTGDWILWLDCDEIVSSELATEIRAAIARPSPDAWRSKRMDYMFGRWIRHGGWFPQYHLRLVRRARARWVSPVHEKLDFDGPIGTLDTPVQHFSHERVEHWIAKMTRYTSLEAAELHRTGRRTSPVRILCEPPLYFGYKYVWQQGWRDGAHGLVLASLLACYRLMRHLKLWDLQQSERGPVEPGTWTPPTSRS